MTIKAFEKDLLTFTLPAAADLSSKQFFAVAISSDQAAAITAQGQKAIGILQNDPTIYQSACIAYQGISRAQLSGTVTQGCKLIASSNGTLIAATECDYECVVGVALSAGVTGDVIPVLLNHSGRSADVIRKTVVDLTSAQVIALNSTAITLVDYSALLAAGMCSAGDALVFHGAVLNIHGGTTDYDQDGDCIIKNETATALSLTLDDFLNDGTAGSISTLKPIATDAAYVVSEDIQLTMTASPKASAGDRKLKVTTYYSVVTPGT